ncbi:hypothetical protein [Cellulomonas dongxiuzhuiae]|uniref:Leucine-rich repeat domain-containing protein n=1 Tax=Cellulomonas dongxiuzhuiae TaxID=2819979 RepID=A0ABX8GK62_9CELL|nr:hypothetical protein [Cellulomonas dongxiuzhuiae]MBO3089322.1 hypothetical protein [Cellulomonas dongxiuzhuiae]MBO3094892.1 hypothetical protein [Cellulomonas dongxiuzhuiae]QWC15921.1 hypothetical protein KKR89_16980 [Cellulomonas dongxiuzhuiae]
MRISTLAVGDGRRVPTVELDKPPTAATIHQLVRRRVRGVTLTSRCWDRRSSTLEWLVELEPLVLFVAARGVVPPIPPAALASVEHLDIAWRTRFRQTPHVSHLRNVRRLVAAPTDIDGPLRDLPLLTDLYLAPAPMSSLELASGMRRLEHVRLDLGSAVAGAPFSFDCAEPPEGLRTLTVHDCGIDGFSGIERLPHLRRLWMRPKDARSASAPLDLTPLGELRELRTVRMGLVTGPLSGVDALHGLPELEVAVIGGLEIRRRDETVERR